MRWPAWSFAWSLAMKLRWPIDNISDVPRFFRKKDKPLFFLTVISSENVFLTVITSGNLFPYNKRERVPTVITSGNVFPTVITSENVFPTIITIGKVFRQL